MTSQIPVHGVLASVNFSYPGILTVTGQEGVVAGIPSEDVVTSPP